jgi:predicted transposase/invertase (TIGR01784 family)
LTDALEIHFVDMVKFRRMVKKDIEREPLHRWLAWFDRNSPAELVAEVEKMDRAIKKAAERAESVFRDKEALRAYQMRQMALSDWTSGINHARREGEQKGERKIVELLESGKSLDEVKLLLGLDAAPED